MSRPTHFRFGPYHNGDFVTFADIDAAFPVDVPYSERELVHFGYARTPLLTFDHRYRWLRTDIARFYRGRFGGTASEVIATFERNLGVTPFRPDGRKR